MAYTKKTWENLPSTNTPLNATSGMNDLENRVDTGIKDADILRTAPNSIATNDDLNTFTTAGTYRCNTAEIAASLTNCPHTTSAFKLIVMKLHDDTRYVQIIVASDTSSNLYIRSYTNAGWGNWKSINSKSEDYSASEKVIGTWIDGKPLYRKVIYISALPNNTAASYASGISNFKRLINMTGWFQGNGGTSTGNDVITRPINFMLSAAETYNIYGFYNVTTGNIRITTLNDLSYLSGYVIMEYTKTTD